MHDNILIFILVGFLAQIIDGALGMAYGVISTSFLLSLGLPTSVASANVHISEVFTTFFSGLSHLKLGNVNKNLFKTLLFPGVIGGILGAYILSSLPGNLIEPFVSVYLLLIGIKILIKSKKNFTETKFQSKRKLSLLALVGVLILCLSIRKIIISIFG